MRDDRLYLGDVVRHPLGWLAVVTSVEEEPWLHYSPPSLWGTPEQMAAWTPTYAIDPVDNKNKPGKYAWWSYPHDMDGNLELVARRPQ